MTNRWRLTIVAALAIVLGVAANAGWRWWHNRPPYGPEALAATASLELVAYDTAVRTLGEDVNAPYPHAGDQLVLGRVSWPEPPRPLAGGRFVILLIDKRTDLKPEVFAVATPRPHSVALGTEGGSMQTIAERYPWLTGAGSRRTASGWSSAGNAIYVSTADATPLTFVAFFPAVEQPQPVEFAIATAPVTIPDLLLAMVYVGPDDQIFWAQRLVG